MTQAVSPWHVATPQFCPRMPPSLVAPWPPSLHDPISVCVWMEGSLVGAAHPPPPNHCYPGGVKGRCPPLSLTLGHGVTASHAATIGDTAAVWGQRVQRAQGWLWGQHPSVPNGWWGPFPGKYTEGHRKGHGGVQGRGERRWGRQEGGGQKGDTVGAVGRGCRKGTWRMDRGHGGVGSGHREGRRDAERGHKEGHDGGVGR